jgi:hypothetical protein
MYLMTSQWYDIMKVAAMMTRVNSLVDLGDPALPQVS